MSGICRLAEALPHFAKGLDPEFARIDQVRVEPDRSLLECKHDGRAAEGKSPQGLPLSDHSRARRRGGGGGEGGAEQTDRPNLRRQRQKSIRSGVFWPATSSSSAAGARTMDPRRQLGLGPAKDKI